MTTESHLIIPDLQADSEDDLEFSRWIGQYGVDHMAKHPDWRSHWIQLGDLGDFHSLSWYDRGKKSGEGSRVEADIKAYEDCLGNLTEPLELYNAGRRKKWKPELWVLDGNHEERLDRYSNDHPEIDSVGTHRLNRHGWTPVPFLQPLELGGVLYAHYFYNMMTGKPYGGANAETRLKTIGHSFTMGHQPGLLTGVRPTINGLQRALVAGSAYVKNLDYMGPQTHNHWRGILVAHAVENGNYNLMEVDLPYLCERYSKGHKTLTEWKQERGIK